MHAPWPTDLAHAQRIQRSFLPSLPARIPGFRVAAEYRPMIAVGGDFYDVVVGRGPRLFAAVGDVAGKGVSGALWMARATLELRHILRTRTSPIDVLRALDQALAPSLLAEGDGGESVALVCLLLDLRRGVMRVANAGHMPPLLRRHGRVRAIGAPSAPPIGLLPPQRWREDVLPMARGDLIVVATDGVTDRLRSADDPLGTRSLSRVVKGLDDPHELGRRVRAHHGKIDDDCTYLAIEVVGGR